MPLPCGEAFEVWTFAWARCPCYVARASRPCGARPPVWPLPLSERVAPRANPLFPSLSKRGLEGVATVESRLGAHFQRPPEVPLVRGGTCSRCSLNFFTPSLPRGDFHEGHPCRRGRRHRA